MTDVIESIGDENPFANGGEEYLEYMEDEKNNSNMENNSININTNELGTTDEIVTYYNKEKNINSILEDESIANSDENQESLNQEQDLKVLLEDGEYIEAAENESTTEVISQVLSESHLEEQSPIKSTSLTSNDEVIETLSKPNSQSADAASPVVSPVTFVSPSEIDALSAPIDDSTLNGENNDIVSNTDLMVSNQVESEDIPIKNLEQTKDIEELQNFEENNVSLEEKSLFNQDLLQSSPIKEENNIEMQANQEKLETYQNEINDNEINDNEINDNEINELSYNIEESEIIEEKENIGQLDSESIEKKFELPSTILNGTLDTIETTQGSVDISFQSENYVQKQSNKTKPYYEKNNSKVGSSSKKAINSSFSTKNNNNPAETTLSKAEIIQLEAKSITDSLNRMKKREELKQKYHFDRLIYDPVTNEIKKASELRERNQIVKKKFNFKLKAHPKDKSEIQNENLESNDNHVKETDYQRRLNYYESVVKILNNVDEFKKEYKKKMKEAKKQKFDELIFTKKIAEFKEKEIEELKEKIKEKKRKSIKAAFAEEERREKINKLRRRSKSTQELKKTKSSQDLLKKSTDKTEIIDDQKNRWDDLISKINYPKLKLKRQPTPTLTEFQLEISKKQSEKREPTQPKEIDYLAVMKKLRKRANKRKKLLEKRKAAKEKKKEEVIESSSPVEDREIIPDVVEESVEVVAVEEAPPVIEEIIIPTSKKRQFILNEIYTTEKDYVSHLQHLIDRYAIPIKEQNLLPENIQDTLFSSLYVIKDVHVNMMEELELFRNENFLDPLEAGGLKREKGLSLGNIFLEIAPAFKQYTDYINDYELIYDIVTKSSKKYKKFDKFCKQETQLRVEENDRFTDLPDYLILPIQRIPRYRMLLEDLVKNTSDLHPDYVATKEALQLIIDIADYCNAMKKEKQNRERMEQLVKMLKIKELSHPKRRFIREGAIKIPIPGSKKQKEGTLYLFSDLVVLKVKKPAILKLFDAAAQEYKIDILENSMDPTFHLVTGSNLQNTQPIICQSNYDLNEWVAHFNMCHSLEDPIEDIGYSNLDSDVLTSVSTSDLISSSMD